MRILNTKVLTLLGVVALLSAHFAGGEAAEWGPSIGTPLDSALTATTADGKPVALSTLTGENGLVIAFVRSADWCMFCKRQLIDLNGHAAEFEARGLRLVALSYDSTDILAQFAGEHDIGITLLSDEGSRVIDAFGIRNPSYKAGTSGYGVPHPGIVVFDRDARLIAKFAEKSYRKRPDISEMLTAIDVSLAK